MTTNALDRDVRLAVYRSFAADGHPPVAAELARRLAVTPYEVELSLQRLADAHMLVLAPGTPYVWMANPFSALATPYEAHVGERTYWGNCIWDALGIVAMLGSSGRVSAPCPDCGEDLSLSVVDDAIEGRDYVIHYAIPARHWWDDIGFN